MTDWTTVIASGGIGAVAGALTSWVAAPHLANRQERGRRHLEARQAISAAVNPILTDIRQYQAHARSSLARDPDADHFHMNDLNLCAELLAKSENLSIWRRPFVRRRLNRLFGPTTVEMCRVHGKFAADPRSSMGVVINRQLNTSRNPEQFPQPDRGTFDAALRKNPDSVEVAALIASLEQLRDSR